MVGLLVPRMKIPFRRDLLHASGVEAGAPHSRTVFSADLDEVQIATSSHISARNRSLQRGNRPNY